MQVCTGTRHVRHKIYGDRVVAECQQRRSVCSELTLTGGSDTLCPAIQVGPTTVSTHQGISTWESFIH